MENKLCQSLPSKHPTNEHVFFAVLPIFLQVFGGWLFSSRFLPQNDGCVIVSSSTFQQIIQNTLTTVIYHQNLSAKTFFMCCKGLFVLIHQKYSGFVKCPFNFLIDTFVISVSLFYF